jgi:prefoldin subunit 5
MKITFKKSWNPWRQAKNAEEMVNLWQDYIDSLHDEIDSLHDEIFRLENALECIKEMRPKSRRNLLAHSMADVAFDANFLEGESR